MLLSGSETTTLTVLTGQNLTMDAQVTLDCLVTTGDGSVQINQTGIAYFDENADAVIFLDPDLRETRRVELPKDHAGNAVIAPGWDKVYYCTESAVHVMDLKTGFSRMIKSHSKANHTLSGIFFAGEMLGCCMENEERGKTVYFSAETGATQYNGRQLTQLSTDNDTYFAAFEDGTVRVCLTGMAHEEPQMLELSQSAAVYPLLGQKALVTVETLGADAQIRYLDLETGKYTGAVTLKNGADIACVTGDGEFVWIIARISASENQHIYRWDPLLTPLDHQQSYLRDHVTVQNPDVSGLEKCKAFAQTMGDEYGVDIMIWEDPIALQPGGYAFEAEYQVAAYERDLVVLKRILGTLPEGFLEDAASGTNSGRLTISLVRSLGNDTDHNGQVKKYGTQYWLDESAYIALEMGPMLEQAFYHELSHLIDNRVFSTTLAYDAWTELNPDGFSYDYSYLPNRYREDEIYLEGEDRAFVDTYSMTYPMEDRARILEYAAVPGNAEVFESKIMQRKLQTMCMGIREAFKLDSTANYPWEQYLHEPLPEKE